MDKISLQWQAIIDTEKWFMEKRIILMQNVDGEPEKQACLYIEKIGERVMGVFNCFDAEPTDQFEIILQGMATRRRVEHFVGQTRVFSIPPEIFLSDRIFCDCIVNGEILLRGMAGYRASADKIAKYKLRGLDEDEVADLVNHTRWREPTKKDEKEDFKFRIMSAAINCKVADIGYRYNKDGSLHIISRDDMDFDPRKQFKRYVKKGETVDAIAGEEGFAEKLAEADQKLYGGKNEDALARSLEAGAMIEFAKKSQAVTSDNYYFFDVPDGAERDFEVVGAEDANFDLGAEYVAPEFLLEKPESVTAEVGKFAGLVPPPLKRKMYYDLIKLRFEELFSYGEDDALLKPLIAGSLNAELRRVPFKGRSFIMGKLYHPQAGSDVMGRGEPDYILMAEPSITSEKAFSRLGKFSFFVPAFDGAEFGFFVLIQDADQGRPIKPVLSARQLKKKRTLKRTNN